MRGYTVSRFSCILNLFSPAVFSPLFFPFLFSLWLITGCAHANDLVSVDWLAEHASDPELVIVDLRKHEDYLKGHIPGAINLPFSKLTKEKGGVAGYVESPGNVQQLLSQIGINNSHTLVLYSDFSFLESMRSYWVMDFFGHEKTLILDGGLQAWSERFPDLSLIPVQLEPSQYVVRIHSDVITSKIRILAAIHSQDYVIVDARDTQQYAGIKSLTNRKGHIPGAMNFPWFQLVDNRDEKDFFDRLKTPTKLVGMAELKQKISVIPEDKHILLYCNGGQEASVLYFALKSLGIDSAVYDGSWFEWGADPKLPIEP
jgi:thiosulfate/3-mercaptopyruvate sulfurtransferase